MGAETLYLLGLFLIFVGILIVLIVTVLSFVGGRSGEGKGEVRGGGALILGPFPIVFGTDEKSIETILVLAIALTVVTVLLYLVSS